jgi:Mg2+ and Co2+ transporter CorA
VAVLTAKQDPKNPMAGKLVGSDESVEREESMLEAEMAEDVLEKVQRSFKDFIKQAEEQIKDSDIKEKKKEDTDLKNKEVKDRALKVKDQPVAEDPTTQETPGPTMTSAPVTNPTYGESAPVKSVALKDDMICEIHGNERDGFEIRRGARSLPTRFKNIEQAELALEMFMARMKRQDESQDYLDEE